MKLVSVIVLAYKSTETIEQTLDSIRGQDYGNIELIITDDCSPDNTVEIAQNWIEKNKQTLCSIKLVTAAHNTGLAGNINRALAYASGEYVKIIAADDYMVADAISAYVAFCENNPKAVPIAKVHLFSDDKMDFSSIEDYCESCYEFAGQDYMEQYRRLLTQNCIITPSGSFYPMDVVRKVGGYDEHYRWFEDYPMNLKVMYEGYRFGLIDKELVWYRISGKSVSSTQRAGLKKEEMQLFFRQRAKYMIKAGMGLEALKQMRYWIKVAFSKK